MALRLAYLSWLLRVLDTRRRIEAIQYARRVPVMREQLEIARGTF